MAKLGSETRGTLYIQLSNFPNHYLVLVVTDERFQYALITTSVIPESMFGSMILEDIAWLDFDRIHDKAKILVMDGGSNRREGINRQLEDENPISIAASAKNQSNG
jgi:mediator of RNA polymerase II transcription subunit 14